MRAEEGSRETCKEWKRRGNRQALKQWSELSQHGPQKCLRAYLHTGRRNVARNLNNYTSSYEKWILKDWE